MTRILCAGLLLLMVIWASAAPMVKIGNHPTSPQTAYPRIHSLHAFDGRLYLSYGDYNDYPAMVIVAYDPVANQFRLEESASSDSVGYFRAAGRFGSDLRPPAPVLQSLGNAGGRCSGLHRAFDAVAPRRTQVRE